MKYISRKRELRLIMRPTDRSIDEHRRIVIHPGKKAEFMDGRFETTDPELIEWLHTHPYRGSKFDEVTPKDENVVEIARNPEVAKAKPHIVVPIATGAVSTGNILTPPEPQAEPINFDVEPRTRPNETAVVSPELVRMIDERIQAAMGTIIDLLKPEAKKEEKAVKIMAGQPTKSFKCPFCDEVFQSGFAVGKHKKEVHTEDTQRG